MTLATTSRIARRQVEPKIGKDIERIVSFVLQGGNHTRAEIAKATGIPLQTVCARTRDILDAEYPRLRELQPRDCKVTGNPSKPLTKVAPQGPTPLDLADHPRTKVGQREDHPASAAPDEGTPVYDKNGKLLYFAYGQGPGWPMDQDHLHKRTR